MESKIEDMRRKIDQSRRARMIEAKVDKEKMALLKKVKDNVGLTGEAIHQNKDHAVGGLQKFNAIITEAKEIKT